MSGQGGKRLRVLITYDSATADQEAGGGLKLLVPVESQLRLPRFLPMAAPESSKALYRASALLAGS